MADNVQAPSLSLAGGGALGQAAEVAQAGAVG
jgi:hypothetical protein